MQHDLTIANQGFPAFRSDLNSALQAIGSCQSGTSAPSPTFANQLWYDTTNDILKIRNEDNDAWINLLTLDQSGDVINSIGSVVLANIVSLAGTQNLTNKTLTNAILTNPTINKINTGVSGAVIGSGDSSLIKNRIQNGDMVIDQRNYGASITPTNGQYTLDRWAAYVTKASKFTVQQNAGAVTPPAGFTKYLGATSSSAYSLAAGDYFVLGQNIEGFNVADLGWGTANAKTITLSFQVYSSLTGTFGGSLKNNLNNRSYPFTYSVSVANTWTTISITVTGDVSGTWETDNSAGIRVIFGLGVGTTYSGTASSWSSGNYYSSTGATSVVTASGAKFYITGIQLEIGEYSTGFNYSSYSTNFTNCQRYYQKHNVSGRAYGGAVSTFYFAQTLPVQMRAAPTTTTITAPTYTNASGFLVGGLTADNIVCYATITALGDGVVSNAVYDLSAEL